MSLCHKSDSFKFLIIYHMQMRCVIGDEKKIFVSQNFKNVFICMIVYCVYIAYIYLFMRKKVKKNPTKITK